MSLGYLSGTHIKELLALGAVEVRYGTSDTPQHLGDLTSVYFFDASGTEIAHQTQLSDTYTLYRRTWGHANKAAYEQSFVWNRLMAGQDDLVDSIIYLIV